MMIGAMESKVISMEEAREMGLLPSPYVCGVFFNGPAGSGKDHMAKLMAAGSDQGFHAKFSQVLKDIVAIGLGMDPDLLESMKDERIFGPNGNKSYRDYQIEEYKHLEDRYDDRVLGRFAIEEIKHTMENSQQAGYAFFFSDAGREPEVDEVAKYIGKESCLIVRLHRDGYEFNDYRQYAEIENVETWDEYNDGTNEWAELLKWRIVEWLQLKGLKHQGIPDAKARKAMELHKQIEALMKQSNELMKEIEKLKNGDN